MSAQRKLLEGSVEFLRLSTEKIDRLETGRLVIGDKLREAETHIEDLKDENRAVRKMMDRLVRALTILGVPRGLVDLIADGG